MPKQYTKHTHTVQKEYLKLFSEEEKGKFFLWRFDKTTVVKKRLPIDKVSVENYFYPQDIEDWLANNIVAYKTRTLLVIESKIMPQRKTSIDYLKSYDQTLKKISKKLNRFDRNIGRFEKICEDPVNFFNLQ